MHSGATQLSPEPREALTTGSTRAAGNAQSETHQVDSRSAQALLRRSLFALAIGAALVAICYWAVDRPVARLVWNEHLAQRTDLVWATKINTWLLWTAPFAIGYAALRVLLTKSYRADHIMLAAALAVLVADQLAESFKPIFGRYWPETWIDNNPSYISDGAYGFHPLQWGSAYGSFPSGHTTTVCALTAVLWLAWPRGRALWSALPAIVVAGLLANNYHFVGDTLGGGVLGSIVGVWTARWLVTGFRIVSVRDAA